MGGVDSGSSQRPPAAIFRLGFALAGALAFILGFVGIYQFSGGQDQPAPRLIDILYQTIQLFVLEQSYGDVGPYPMVLEIARFVAPAVTAYAFFEAGRVLFASEARRLRARSARGHVVVCGDNLFAAGLARRLRAAGHRVVTVWPARGTWVQPPGPLSVVGDARDPDVLRTVGAARAAAIYACTEDSAANTAIALAAGGAIGRSGPTAVYAHVADPELCLALQARHLSAARPSPVRLDFFNIDELAARHLCSINPLRSYGDSEPHMLIAGMSAFGRAVIVELARQWRVCRPSSGARLPISVIDQSASVAVGELAYRYPFLPRVCRLFPYDVGLADLLRKPAEVPPASRVFICYDDEQLALKTALTADLLWSRGAGSVVVRQDHLGTFHTVFGAAGAQRLFDEVSDTLRLFGVVDAACDPELVRDDLSERLARAIHERYLLARRRGAGSGPGGAGGGGELPASVRPWEKLDDHFRKENRAQAADIGRKLRAVTCVLAPRVRPGDEHVWTPAEIKQLAQLEHERWLTARINAGWRHGERRDDGRQLHPAIREWGDLSEPMRRRNHDAVRELPRILADCGFRIVRR